MQTGRSPRFHGSVDQVLAAWQARPRVAESISHVRVEPPRAADLVDLPTELDARLRGALWKRGVTQLYRHQADALAAVRAGHDVVVATPTASGKSLCYHLPVLDALLRDPGARALYLFPTKALARDQVASVRELVEACGAQDLGVAVYDGDTPPDQRRVARTRARILVTNPDMLHAGILPHHAGWAGLFASLKVVVVDELHVYRGVFGSGVANVMRRLRRIAAFHGADPRFVATSATIANPGELAGEVMAAPAPVRVIDRSGAPTARRTFVVVNPPVIDSALGLRASYLKTAKRFASDLVAAGVSTLVFGRSRRAVEILVRYLRDDLAQDGASDLDPAEAIRGYRGGYLPNRRREVEQALRAGDTRCVVATSALELGIDVGGLDAVVIAGWPGSRAAAWQRAGRAGRRGEPSLVVLVASSEPLDQYVAADPEFLFGQPAEHGRIGPDNPAILVPHVKCAAFELPFGAGEGFGPLDAALTRDVLGTLVRKGLLHEDGRRGTFHWIADAYPAQGVPLRGIDDENFQVIDLACGQVLAEVDFRDAPRQLHEHAIYPLEGKLFQVERLDHDDHKAYVRAVDVDYTTDALAYTRIRPLEVLHEHQAAQAATGFGEVHVVEKVVGFKKIRLHTHENVGYGDVALPEIEMHTRGLWFDLALPPEASHGTPVPHAAWLDGVERAASALRRVAALVVLSETGDLGHAVETAEGRTGASSPGLAGRGGEAPLVGAARHAPDPDRLPRIYLYDRMPGGIGLVERLYDERQTLVVRAARLIAACPCAAGCPGCVGPTAGLGAPGKRAAAQLLAHLARLLGAATDDAPAPVPDAGEAPSDAAAELVRNPQLGQLLDLATARARRQERQGRVLPPTNDEEVW